MSIADRVWKSRRGLQRAAHQGAARVRLVVGYRRKDLESLVRQGEEEAGKIAREHRQASAQQEHEDAEKAAAHFGIDRPRERRHLAGMFAALVLLLVVVVYRVASGFAGSADFQWMHNVAPVAAVALCGAVYLPRRIAVALPLAMLFASDVILNVFHYHQPLLTFDILPRYAALALISAIGFALRGRAGLTALVGASLAGSLVFYVITNTGSWITDPGYTKDFAGWTQALTGGLPGFPSTWWFYRHTLLGDVCFTLLFATCMALQPQKQAEPRMVKEDELVPW